jgi:hypothetical protein
MRFARGIDWFLHTVFKAENGVFPGITRSTLLPRGGDRLHYSAIDMKA